MSKKILLIGGGTGGHICPLKPLAQELLKLNQEVHILTSDSDLDQKIINQTFSEYLTKNSRNFGKIHFHTIKTGKIRRYLSTKNIKDSFQIIKAIFFAKKFLKKYNFEVLFFKGGFVGFPILIATKLTNFSGKIFSHESDISVGTMTKFASKFATKTLQSFGNPNYPLFTTNKIPNNLKLDKIKAQITSPLNEDAKKEPNLKNKLPQIFITGGSQGAQFFNNLIKNNADFFNKNYQTIIITGPNKKIKNLENFTNIQQFEFINSQKLSEYLIKSDLIISRGGANSIFEILTNQKLSIIIPLPSAARNHQFLNAQYFAKKQLLNLIEQKKCTINSLEKLIKNTLKNSKIRENLNNLKIKSSEIEIAKIISN